MRTAQRKILYGEYAVRRPRAIADWDSVRVFLSVARNNSFGIAARQLQLSSYVVRRHIGELEKALGSPLLIKQRNRVQITPLGEKILAAAGKMDDASSELLRLREQVDAQPQGNVQLAITEGLGAFWVMPRLMQFRQSNPNLAVQVNCGMVPVDVSKNECDVAIQLVRPRASKVETRKIGRLHLMPFASPEYLSHFGTPASAQDLMDHRILVQADDQRKWIQLYNRIFPHLSHSKYVAIRNNISSAHYWSIARSAGIGLLPTYAGVIEGAPLVALDLGLREYLDIWLICRPESKRVARISRLIDWLIDAFSPDKYPWFRDEFIHPNELMDAYKGEPLWRP